VTVLDSTAAPARFELQTIPPGAAAPTVVAGWDAKNWDVPLSGSRGLVVDSATGTAYVLNPPGTDDLDASVVPVTLATGAIGTTIAVDKDVIEVSMALSPDGRELYLADTHTGAAATAPGDPILWTLG
jgi:DNA-binding beta-propeller fold protein YncE